VTPDTGIEQPDAEGPSDLEPGQDSGIDGTGLEDLSGGTDGSTSDTGTPPGDTNGDPVDVGVPAGPIQVLSAFSPDGVGVTVRFNKPVDPAAGADPTHFQVLGSDSSKVPVVAAKVAAIPTFVNLTLDAGIKINPALTYTMLASNLTAADGASLDAAKKKATIKRTVYMQLMWHQHQPTYLDSLKDQLMSPWVRKHATKDYYDMASVLGGYADVHVTINLTPVLLNQLIPYYIDRLGPFVDKKANTVDAAAFAAKWKGKTDPWVDLLLEPTPDPETATEKQKGLLYADPWACVSTSDATMKHFPDYVALRLKNPATYTKADFLGLKIWFEIAWFDPDFLRGPVQLASGETVDLTDIVKWDKTKDTYALKVPLSEQLANRLLAEEEKIMEAVIPIHQQMRYSPATQKGQIEIATTPFYHPILPLLFNTDLAKQGQSFDPMPSPAYNYPEDADAQVARAVAYYKELFGEAPAGMWPGEGSVGEDVVSAFVKSGVLWVATDQQVLESSQPPGGKPIGPYMVDADGGPMAGKKMAIFFRNTQMSNDIGFAYQGKTGPEAASELMKNIIAQAPPFGAKDRVITLVLDGENAWESYVKEHDGKGFFHALYAKLQESYEVGEIITVGGAEYLLGNPNRNVPAHATAQLPKLTYLFPGSWIGGNFAVWIGEAEENTAWEFLRKARDTLEATGLAMPDWSKPASTDTTSLAYYTWKAYDEMFAAEGSDWFWWYGDDMTSPSNDDTPFDQGFRSHLAGSYQFMNLALAKLGKPPVAVPDLAPIIQAKPQAPTTPFTKPPAIDGQFLPNEGEWTAEGGFFFDSDSGAMANPDDWVATVYYGFGTDALYVSIVSNFPLTSNAPELDLYFSNKHIVDAALGTFTEDPFNTTTKMGTPLGFNSKGAARMLAVTLAQGASKGVMQAANGSGAWAAGGVFTGQIGGPTANGKVVELKIPWSDLNIVWGDPIEIAVVAVKGGKDIDLAPNGQGKILIQDELNQIFVTFECDVSGSKVAIDTYGTIANFPPPKGKGIVYIAGNNEVLGMKAKWNPNKIALRDDGKGGDAAANDQIWSGIFKFPRGTTVRYKYTIGLPKDEGSWTNTEEFPLTERGFDVTKDPSKTKTTIQDIFADRPQPTGTLGPNTVLTNL